MTVKNNEAKLRRYKKVLGFLETELSPAFDKIKPFLQKNLDDSLEIMLTSTTFGASEFERKMNCLNYALRVCIHAITPEKPKLEQIVDMINETDIDLETAASMLSESKDEFSREQIEELENDLDLQKNCVMEQFEILSATIEEVLYPSDRLSD